MSACTEALVSLRQILVTILHLQPRYHIHYRPQLQDLLEEVDSLLNFLEISSAYEASQVAEVETKIRDAAHRAERVINIHGVPKQGVMSSDNILSFNILFFMLSPALARLDVRPVILVEAVICIMNAAFLYLWVREKYGFPTRNASWEWHRLFYDFRIIAEEVNETKESSSALISLRQILGSIILDDSGYNTQHLKSLNEKVSFLLENASSCAQKNLDANAVYKAKRALIEFQLPSKSDLIFDWRRFCTLFDVLLLISPFWFFIFFRFRYHMGIIPYYLRFNAHSVGISGSLLYLSCNLHVQRRDCIGTFTGWNFWGTSSMLYPVMHVLLQRLFSTNSSSYAK